MHTEHKIGMIGLGLIGASMAKAFKENTDSIVAGYDINPETITKAVTDGVIDKEARFEECDIIISALYPKATVEFVQKYAKKIKKNALVLDCGGTKRFVCSECERIAKENGFKFIGMHPMAGTEHSGYDYSRGNLFEGASLIICSEEKQPDLEELFGKIGFTVFRYTTADEHDKIISFTSQLAHVVSNAFVKSPEYPLHMGYSAGSLKDLTRVAWLNETMWTELFLENADNLIFEIDTVIENLKKYSDALKTHNDGELKHLLKEGRMIKEQVDGR